LPAFDQQFDGVCEVFSVDVMIAASNANLMRLDHHVRVAATRPSIRTRMRDFKFQGS